MRFFSIITAILVMGILYMWVLERDQLLGFAVGGNKSVVEDTGDSTTTAESPAPDTEAEETTAGLVSVVVMKSAAQDIANAVVVRGRTEAARQVDIRAETSGQVISDPLRKGAYVATGQMLCQLDPGTREASLAEALARLPEAAARVPEAEARLPEAQARLTEAYARVAEADINLRAAKRLAKDGYASDTRVAAAEAANEAALASVHTATAGVAGADAGVQSANAGILTARTGVAAAQKEIERLTLIAPFSGHLESDAAETGTLLQPGALCATVIQLDPIKLVGFVPETSVDQVETGAMAGARLATGREISGQVTFLSRSADEQTRTFRVEIQVANTDLSIRDGQTVEIIIASDSEKAHLLPQSSMTLDDEGQIGVRAVSEANIVTFYPIGILRDTAEGIWVTGLPDLVDVIVVGQEYVVDGVTVQVSYLEAAG